MERKEAGTIEKIGGVTLDYTWYPGEDLYSDGDVEEELLQIARDYTEGGYDQVVAQRKSWPVLYHFSRVRQNIISWLPVTKEHEVLEIGSGCGALTGMLAQMAGHVTCVELSRRRSQINGYRNRLRENIEILVGNYQDIEKKLGRFDLITLIGVFEYAKGYIGGEDPYVEMLRQAVGHLKPGGQIVLAIENRIGLKYWAGFTEDHVGEYYEGLEGYPDTDGVRTFSKPALCEVIRQAGDLKADFYYPFPDYKLPRVIYSDAYLPKPGELGEDFPNYDRERILAFSEGRVLDSLIQDGLFDQFANSFLVILEKEEGQG
ncbi:MAG: class I SAM-dependent methyltransferase [Lachnospiraceae bacterium]|nr:class I SAM-dependent methyltransferase [Lachnospiraceae bacterium]